jgi:hypothetical protein
VVGKRNRFWLVGDEVPMKFKSLGVVLALGATMQNAVVAMADAVPSPSAPSVNTSPVANSNAFPRQILRTGINLSATDISPNSMQLANDIRLAPVLEQITSLRQKVETMPPSSERAEARTDLLEARLQALQIIERTSLEIDFVIAEMNAEQNVYTEILSSFTSDRDKLLARVNAGSFISNGVLWAVCEGLDIPTYKYPRLAIPSGTVGILAGIVPSLASMYTLRAVNGKKKTSEVEPNMLAKLFGYPTTADIEYPKSVWVFLNQVPAGSTDGKTRKDQMIDRWIADSNIPGFTKRDSKTQLDVITGSVAQKKGLTISTLSTRQVMLTQSSAEVLKMKRMLLELSMVVQGDKQFVATQMRPTLPPTSSAPGGAPRAIANKSAKFSSDAAVGLTSQALMGLGVP